MDSGQPKVPWADGRFATASGRFAFPDRIVDDPVLPDERYPLHLIAQATTDEAIRVRWLTGPVGRQLVDLAGPMELPAAPGVPGMALPAGAPDLEDSERRLLQLLTEGRTNAEIATELGLHEVDVAQRLAQLQARLGASSRAEATSLAFRGLATVGSH